MGRPPTKWNDDIGKVAGTVACYWRGLCPVVDGNRLMM